MSAEIKTSRLIPYVDKIPEWIRQMGKFMTVGVLNTLIDAGTYFVLTRWMGLGGILIFAKGVAYAVGMVNSFFWNRTWTFQSRANPWRAAGLFTLTHVAALGINAGMMAVCLNFLNFGEGLALGLATAAAFGWNFGLNRYVVFKKTL